MEEYKIFYGEKVDLIACQLCGRFFDYIFPHLRSHKMSIEKYREMFPKAKIDIHYEIEKIRKSLVKKIKYPTKYENCLYCKRRLKKSDYTYAYLLLVENKEIFSYCRHCLIGKTGSDRGCNDKLKFAMTNGALEPIRRIRDQFVNEKRKLIRRIIDQLGFIPSFNFVNSTTSFSTRSTNMFNKALVKKNAFEGIDILNDYHYLLVFSHIVEKNPGSVGPNAGLKSFYDQEGSWIKLLIDSEVLEDNILRTSRGYKCISEDGCVCNSLAELSIDNWLHRHKIKHEKEVFYPKDQVLNPNSKLRTDWVINNYFIEFFGLKGEEDYDRRIDIKRELCGKYKIKLIEIHNEDLSELDKVLVIFDSK